MKEHVLERSALPVSPMWLAGLLLATAAPAAIFHYSVDIGGDLEWCDPNADGDEGMDPAWIYVPAAGSYETIKTDWLIWGHDPPPNASLRVPYQGGSPADAASFFDIDGEDQLELKPGDPQGPLEGPVAIEAVWTAGLFYNPPRLYYSLDDDKASGWWATDVPVTASPDRGAGTDEILRAEGWRAWAAPGLPASDESALGLTANPLPMNVDDDVDALDTRRFRYWFWTCDHEAHYGLDPGSIYVTDTAAAGANHQIYIPRALLGVPPGTDLDAFEFCVTADPDLLTHFGLPAGSYLAVVFSVDQDDPTTPAVNESGGLSPNTVYISLLSATGIAPVAVAELEDDIDAIALDLVPHDFGDAPEHPYPTTRLLNGARHRINALYCLGSAVDEDLDGQPDPNALGDDNDLDGDDEDGVTFTSLLVPGQTASVDVVASTNGFLDAWVDFGGDGSWADLSDQIFASQPLAPGLNALVFSVPATAVPNAVTYARFRYSSYGGLTFTGGADDGEVEDEEVLIEEGQEPEPDYKWIQTPDLSPFGMDVDAMETGPTLLADDFLCTQTTAITNIVVWGSWKNDLLPAGNPNNVLFHLSFHADIPAGAEAPWSMPGETLWVETLLPGTFLVRQEMDNLTEGWYDPATGSWLPLGDTVCWRYEFPIDIARAFVQTGTVDHPVVYWLDVQATPLDEQGARFGWKTSPTHWNDDACWAPAVEPYDGNWLEMRYPQGHELQGQSIDLAFALSGGPVPQEGAYDFGDAPDWTAGTGPGDYQTTLADNGAYHTVVAGAPYFDDGSLTDQPDTEPDGQPDPTATGDDSLGTAPDDEDGIVIPVLMTGQGGSATITVDDGAGGGGGGGGYVDAWIDFNGDGDWTDPGERIYSAWMPQGPTTIYFFVPSGAVIGQTFGRFRINSQSAGLLPTGGPAVDGEVEDHTVWIEASTESALKWLQPPDLTTNGFDVDCMSTRPILLADDFLCRAHSAITNITVWGSWRADNLPKQDGIGSPSNVMFTLSIHADVPAGVQAPWSMPGQALWVQTFTPGTFMATIVSIDNLVEGWYDPATSNWMPNADWTCWRYEFPLDLVRAFVQTGTVDNPIIYWLDVQATPQDETGLAQFGWKSTHPSFRWNDDACWTPNQEPYSGVNWYDMHYPPPHPYHQGYTEQDSLGLAFALASEPIIEPEQVDWGDAPDGPYPTLSASGGASHRIGGPWLGDATDAPDSDPDGQPDPNALGDDGDGNDDEDGVSFPALIVGLSANVGFTVSGAPSLAYVEMWIDWDGNGSWLDPGEAYAGWFANGPSSFSVTVPLNAVRGQTFARFRISTNGTGTPFGPAQDGEVEDHSLTIEERFDFGDAPDPLYPTLLASGGAYHIATGPSLGDLAVPPDCEADGQPDPGALGDDTAGADDENGVVFPNTLVAGTTAAVNFYVTNAVGLAYMEIWIDWNGNGSWLDPGDYACAGWCPDGWNTVSVAVPATIKRGDSFARARLSSTSTGTPGGIAYDGEVEDYKVRLADIDYGDAPESGTSYATTLANDGARHLLRGVLWMTRSVDSETDGQPTAAADGDDLAGVDDEDGVTLPAYLRQNRSESLTVSVTAACKLNAWIDFNGDGDWADAGEQIFTDTALLAGANPLSILVPPGAAVGTTYARFRVSTAGGDGPAGLADDGEVEDYAIEIREKFPPTLGTKWRQPPDRQYGLNLPSWSAREPTGGVDVGPVVADDWWCDGRPINAIRWWGSYVLYAGPTNELTVTRPNGFRLSWYLDIPTNAVNGEFSRPGPLLRQAVVTLAPYGQRPENTDEVTETYTCTVPLDFLGPSYAGLQEHTFEYNVVLKHPWLEKNTFSREGYEPPCSSNVYWLAIEALYDAPPPQDTHPWGWETAPLRFNWNDDAVTATNTLQGILTPWNDMTYVPPVWPWTMAEQHPSLTKSVNMAFCMLSEVIGRRDTKWSQLPHMILGTDLPSWRYNDPSSPPVPWATQALCADDFVSDGRRITDIHWWGSYIGWQATYNTDEFDPMPPPMDFATERPLGFDLSWHAHDSAANAPGLLITNVFIPIDRCHEVYYCTIPQIGHPYYPFEHEYQYYVDLLDETLDTLPWHEEYGGHYWLNIQAVFQNSFLPRPPGEPNPDFPHEGWGWKIAGIEPDLRLARSVVSNDASSVSWEDSRLPTWHLLGPVLHDLAFELTTDRPRSNTVIRLTSIRRLTNGVVQVTSSGTGWAGTQQLQRRASLVGTPVWETAEFNEVPFPPPAETIWERAGSPASNEFYRVRESEP